MSPTARLPGGDIEPGKTPEQTVIRELAEEVGLKTLSVRYLYDAPYLSGWTACYAAEVEKGEPRLGVDDNLKCDCSRMVGLGWVALPQISSATTLLVVPTLPMGSC